VTAWFWVCFLPHEQQCLFVFSPFTSPFLFHSLQQHPSCFVACVVRIGDDTFTRKSGQGSDAIGNIAVPLFYPIVRTLRAPFGSSPSSDVLFYVLVSSPPTIDDRALVRTTETYEEQRPMHAKGLVANPRANRGEEADSLFAVSACPRGHVVGMCVCVV